MITTSQLERWLSALRSGEWLQGKGNLKLYDASVEPLETRFCCLGVLAEILCEDELLVEDGFSLSDATSVGECVPAGYRLAFEGPHAGELYDTLLPGEFIPHDVQQELAQANDHGKPFTEIARMIERDTEMLTKEAHHPHPNPH